MRVDRHAFFHAGAGESLIAACVDLGLLYKTDPIRYLKLPRYVVEKLVVHTAHRLKQRRDEAEEE